MSDRMNEAAAVPEPDDDQLAVGDLRAGSMKRVAAAVGEGPAAIRSVHEHLALVPEARS